MGVVPKWLSMPRHPLYARKAALPPSWVAGASGSATTWPRGTRSLICEDRAQLEKIPRCAGGCRGSARFGRDRRRQLAEPAGRYGSVKRKDPYSFLYTSGTTGPPEACVLSHGNFQRCG